MDWLISSMDEWVSALWSSFQDKNTSMSRTGWIDWLADDDWVMDWLIVWMDWLTGWWWLSDGLTDWRMITVMDWLIVLSHSCMFQEKAKRKGVWLDGWTDWLVDDWFDPCVFQDKQKISKDKPLIWPLCISGQREDQSEQATDLTHVYFRTKRRSVKTSHWFDPCAFQDKEKINKDKPLIWPLCLSGQREDQ